MSAITVRKLPDDVKQRLRMRAAANGRSMEAEAREILVDALAPPRVDNAWVEALIELGDKYGGIQLELPPRDELAPAADFSDWR
jgi:plasmid stability protein